MKAKLVGTGSFTTVDELAGNGGTPSVQQLLPYGSVLVYSDSGFADPTTLGNNLADYYDVGGYAVIATFANASVPIAGRFVNAGYMLIQTGGQEQPVDSLGVIAEPNRPLVKDLKMLTATSAYRSTGGAINGGIVVASWLSGKPLIVREVIKGRNVVSINAYPPSNGARADFLTGDVAPLLRNAMLFR